MPDHDISPVAPDEAGQAWLAAATGGGLPEPTRVRWQPLRVGIVSLWEYDEAEFWFADGRLVLRGGNGAGKTKILELTTLMLLRGEIAPSILDPFGSQHRTMRFNLLPTGEGDDPRPPADAGLGYAWVEFGRRTESGETRFFVCGMGASARRGSGTGNVNPWHFVTAHRPGKDFALLAGGSAIEQKELKKIDGISVPASATAYRARIADELFGLTPESYDNLTELLKQLRKPKLGERLNPASLAETLREALPPLAGQEVTQLADGWENLEQLRKAMEQTEQAATALAHFVRSGWMPWARVVLRRRADDFVATTTTLDNTTRDKGAASAALTAAQSQVEMTNEHLAEAKQKKQDRDVELRELLESRPYQNAVAAAERVDGLRRRLLGLDGQLTTVRSRADREGADVEQARSQARNARERAARAQESVSGVVEGVRGAAGPAGLADSAERHLPERDVEALVSDHASRTARFDRLKALADLNTQASQQADQSGQAVERAEASLETARQEESATTEDVVQAAEGLRRQIRDWAAAATIATPTGAQVTIWCDQVSELTVIDSVTGIVQPGPQIALLLRSHIASVRAELEARTTQARLRRAPIAQRHEQVQVDLQEVRSGTQTSPAGPTSWRRRDRPDPDARLGAPFWRLVNPVDGLGDDRLSRLEAALAASGMLDAWVSPEGTLAVVDGVLPADIQAIAGRPLPETSLLAVLDPDAEGGVSATIVQRILAGVGWFETAPLENHGDWFSADGGWRLGGLTGRSEPARLASYLGATARAAAKRREIARLETELADLARQLAEIDADLEEMTQARSRLLLEESAVPADAERALGAVVVRLAERTRRRVDCEESLGREQRRHNEDLVRRDATWAQFADYANAQGFSISNLSAQADALREFKSRVDRLDGELDLLGARLEAVETAEGVLLRREEAAKAIASELAELVQIQRRAQVQLQTAEETLGTDLGQQLKRRDSLDTEIAQLDGKIEDLAHTLNTVAGKVIRAEEVLKGHEQNRAAAELARDAALAGLWAAIDGGLAEPLGVAPPERRSVQAAREFATAVRRQITVQAEASREDHSWRRCFSELEKLRQELLPNRDARVQDDDEALGIQQVVVLGDPTGGWQRPHLAAEALTDRVRQQRDNYDGEQQRVLTTLLGSTFIEHLKDRLDYTTRIFAGINDKLARHPTRHGHLVRVLCEADPSDPDAGAVVTALGRGYQELSAERQEMIRAFLARKIDEVRAEAADGGSADWTEQLARALDYRGWLKLSLQYRPGAGSPWAAFDAARHAAKSGGEKVVLLSQPLFAAAVVGYDAAGPFAPRWVWLDEAMTGVDVAIKASFMGLTVDFELDVMLTAHDEWCNYPTVPSVAVYDLARQEHLPGVDAMPYLWCGGVMTAVDVDRLGIATNTSQIPADGLFADLMAGDDLGS